ncbi:Bifunctional inhibitor/lipid-transfer protein/seed storage 2S albumin superfamily protein [Striga hermonthica]|uniref:Bifunctional inhibitor/lipid-transfer protein/seed storage 2S albumin superfamily protein n=1 Tax=Striga hermonthica TaxID=68872 RepID=A0A9N7RM96_STRHE|nr:Bifunctional inhibitor/lipid-transfer protein/seed storage 2S albumin superfamily protein [Striga hermonthica]
MTRGSTKTAGVGVTALLMAAVLLLAVLVHETVAVECNDPNQLSSPCMGAIFGSQTPSTECCEKLREQEPCYCTYLKNSLYSTFICSARVQRLAASCNITIPTNCS